MILITGAGGFVGTSLVSELTRRRIPYRAVTRRGAQNSYVIPNIDGQTNWTKPLEDVDVVVHLASRAHITHETIPLAEAQIQSTNVDATLNLARQAAAAGVKRFVFISSIAALKAGSQMAVYDSSKAALGGLMRNIAHLGAKRGIRANLVYPGLVDTPNGRAAGAGRPSRGQANTPFGRQASAWEIAYAVLFFLSDESVYITAQTIAVDAGLSGL